MWNLEADDDIAEDDADDPFSQPVQPENTVYKLNELYNQVVDSLSKDDEIKIRKQPGLEDKAEEASEDEYDDEFVEEDSYELDSFKMDPSKKQETIADV